MFQALKGDVKYVKTPKKRHANGTDEKTLKKSLQIHPWHFGIRCVRLNLYL